MKKMLSLMVVMLTALMANAEPVTRVGALMQAKAFMEQQQSTCILKPVVDTRKLFPRASLAGGVTVQPYYIFNKGTREGFIIVSGDDQTEPILGYCDEGEFDYQQMPPNMQEWLDDYADQITRLQQGAPPVADAIPTHPKVEQLMKSKWSQGYPYNLKCPEYFTLGRSVTGCVATAMAQLLYYNREKSVSETQAAMPAYTTLTEHPTYGKLHVEGIAEGSPIDWANMKDEYGSATEKQRLAVADLMHYCGVAAKMDYTNSASGAYSYDAYQAFIKYFGYGSSVRYVDYSQVTTDTEWDKIIYNEIAAGRPIYISGANSGGGHAFCADGYDGNLRYHINWGWGGTSDGYYLLTQLTPGQQGIGGSNDGYNNHREVIIGLEPENYGEKAMSFADVNVRNICLKNFDANGDGKLTYGEAAEVEELGTVFKGTAIKTFKELYYFTSVTSLPDDAFNGCSNLTAIRLPKDIQTIGARALKDCALLERFDMPSYVKHIGDEAFAGCTSLRSPALPDELQAISNGLFDGSGIESLDLPITVTSIGDRAFANCPNFTGMKVKTFMPENIQISATAFEGTTLSQATIECYQGSKEYFQTAEVWKDFGSIIEKRELSGGKFATLEAGQTYYLYHMGTGQYLTKGEAYGTQAVVGEEPMRFKFVHTATMPDGRYYLTSEDTGSDGKYLFRTTTDDNVGSGIIAAFVDGKSLASTAYWDIREVSDRVYTMQIPSHATGYQEGLFWGVQTDHASNAAMPTYGIYGDIDYQEHPLACQWRLVAYDQEAMDIYHAADKLRQLLSVAKGRQMKVPEEQAVYDNLESTYDELRSALRSLRKRLGLIDFASDYVGDICVMLFDIDSDGELSYTEASKVNDLGWLFYSYFQNQSTLVSFDELQYFTSVPCIYGNTFQNCVNLESVVLPKNLTHIYYQAFANCKKLQSINLPEYINTIGFDCFNGCTSLHSVTCLNPDPEGIELGEDVFKGVPLSECTLYVPYGSKERYEQLPVWKDFGTIVEVRGRTQPMCSSIEVGKPGYLMNVATRKYVAMGEAYGTQSVVARQGLVYQFIHPSTLPDSVYYLVDQSGNVLFRTSTDSKVGSGVKTCFGDGNLSPKAYWKVSCIGDNTYTLQVPETDADYVADEYLGTDQYHQTNVASPTDGLYYDVKGSGTRWAFVSQADMEDAQRLDSRVETLAEILQKAREAGIDVTEEQAVYDNFESSDEQLQSAVLSVREKLHFITFADTRTQAVCLAHWDADNDGELTFEEAAAVTSIGEIFRGNTNVKSFEELRYFTSLTELPANAFRGAMSLQTVYLPASITSIGDYAFTGCSLLRYVVMLNDQTMLPLGFAGLPFNTTIFVPKSMLEAYQNDEAWSDRRDIVEFTGQPVVTASASRQYGRRSANIRMMVLGAPIDGDPVCTCDVITEPTLPVGDYPISIAPGTVTTLGVDFREGVFTVEPAPLTITAKSYTRFKGQPNPAFEVDYKGFRNRETEEVLTVKPVVICEATAESPVGEYDITVSGAEAQNYEITYVAGKLTVENDPSGIVDATLLMDRGGQLYDLQGRRVSQPRRGLFVKGRRKLVVRP